MPFIFEKQQIEDVVLIKPKVFEDNRGFFMETYKQSEFQKNGIFDNFNQDNHSKSSYGVLRGLHFQKEPYSQSKLIRVIEGKIFDIVVDIRKNSKTFGKYLKIELSSENKNMLYIPSNFAHGFVVISETAEIIYKTNGEYNPNSECGILWNDPDLNIDWGIDFKPILSQKDMKQKTFKEVIS